MSIATELFCGKWRQTESPSKERGRQHFMNVWLLMDCDQTFERAGQRNSKVFSLLAGRATRQKDHLFLKYKIFYFLYRMQYDLDLVA